MNENLNSKVSLYIVKSANGSFFAGFNPEKGKAEFVEDAKFAKKFTNKYDIKLRPDEMLVELVIDLNSIDISLSPPFRPVRKIKTAQV